MNLDEILIVGSTNPNNVQNLLQYSDTKKHIKYNLYTIQVKTQTFYCIIEDDIIIAFIAGQPFSNKDIPRGFIVNEIYVNPKYQHKGYASSLYEYIFQELDRVIISDKEMSPAGIKMWKSLRKQYQSSVKVFDTESGEVLDYESVPRDKLFVPTDDISLQPSRYRLILHEQKIDREEDNRKFYEQLGIEYDRGILDPPFLITTRDKKWI